METPADNASLDEWATYAEEMRLERDAMEQKAQTLAEANMRQTKTIMKLREEITALRVAAIGRG